MLYVNLPPDYSSDYPTLPRKEKGKVTCRFGKDVFVIVTFIPTSTK